MPRVFISHATKDRDFLEGKLIPLLRRAGVETWYCRDDIQTADQWERKIREGLKSSDWFLVVVSGHSLASKWVYTEVSWAVPRREGRIVPVRIDDTDPADLHLVLETIQHVDFRVDSDGAGKALLGIWKGSAAAIEKTSRVEKPKIDEDVSAFWREYWRLVCAEAPDLVMREPGPKTKDSSWIYFILDDFPAHVSLIHKTGNGRVDLQINGMSEEIGRLRERVAPFLDPMMSVEQAGRSAAIRLEVPVVNHGGDLLAQCGAAVLQAIRAAQHLQGWSASHRHVLDLS